MFVFVRVYVCGHATWCEVVSWEREKKEYRMHKQMYRSNSLSFTAVYPGISLRQTRKKVINPE